MDAITVKKRWVYNIECSGMEDVSRILITSFDDDTITGLTDNGDFVTLSKDAIDDIRQARLDRVEERLWRAIIHLVEEREDANRRRNEEARYMDRLDATISTLLKGFTD